MAETRPPDTVTVPEAAGLLRISAQRVYQLINWGRLPGSAKVGRQYYIPVAAIEARLAADRRLASNQCITSQEVAEFFGVDVRTVRLWYTDGELKATKISNTLCFAPSDIIAFVPKTYGGPGRHPARRPTRTLRGRYYPPPADAPEIMKGTER